MATGLHIRNGVTFDGFSNQFSSSYMLSYDPSTGQVGYMGTGSVTTGYVTIDNTGSFLTTGSNGNTQTASGSLTITQNLNVLGTASFQYVNVIYETASVIYSSGSNQFGDATNDTQTLIGTTRISGSLQVTGSTALSDTLDIANVSYASGVGKILGLNSSNRVIYMSGADVVVFPYTGSAIISGSLIITGSQTISGSLGVTGSVFIGNTARQNLTGTNSGGNFSLTTGPSLIVDGPAAGGTNARIFLHEFTTDVFGARIDFARSSQTGDGIDTGELRFWRAYAATSFGQGAYIKATNVSGSTVASSPMKLSFGTTPSGSVTPQQRLVIQENGNVGIGPATASATLHVSGANMIFDIPSKANGYILQSDTNGNATWTNPNNITTATPIYIATGSVTASVNTATGNFNMFTIKSGSTNGLTYTNEGVLTLVNVSGSGQFPTITTPSSFIITGGGVLRLGTNSNNSLLLNTNQLDRWRVQGTGEFVPVADNSYDIGISGTNRVRNIYVAGTGSFQQGLIVTGSTYFKSLPNVSTTNVLSYDTSTGQIYYISTGSLSVATFPYTGNATISGSLTVSGSGITLTGSLGINGSLTNYIITGSLPAGTSTVFQINTGSYTSALAKYTVNKSTNARAGEFMTVWNGNEIVNADISTTDIGSTAEVAFTSSLVGGQIQTNIVTSTSGWNVKMLITYL